MAEMCEEGSKWKVTSTITDGNCPLIVGK